MKNLFRLTLLAVMAISWILPQSLCAQVATAATNTAAAKDSKIDLKYEFKAPTDSDMTFYLMSLDGKTHKWLVKIGEKYVYITTAPKNSLGMRYTLPKAKEIKLYSMAIVDELEVFTQIGALPTEGFSDFLMASFVRDGQITGKPIDLSLENMPIGTMNFVNLQPINVGIVVSKKAHRLPLFGHFKKLIRTNRQILSEYIQVFSLRNPSKPQEFYNTELTFDKDNRGIVFLMGLVKRNVTNSDDMNQFVHMQNSSPR